MGGLIILFSLVVPTLLWSELGNVFVILILVSTLLLGGVGFLDDYLKVVKKKKKGLIGKYKIMGQVTVGLILALTIIYSPGLFKYAGVDITTATTVPFFKNLVFQFGDVLYILFVIFVEKLRPIIVIFVVFFIVVLRRRRCT